MIKQKYLTISQFVVRGLFLRKILSSFIGSRRNWISFKWKFTKKKYTIVLFARKTYVLRTRCETLWIFISNAYLFSLSFLFKYYYSCGITLRRDFVAKHRWKRCLIGAISFFLSIEFSCHVPNNIEEIFFFFHYLLSILMSARGLCINYSVVNLASKSKM